MRHKINKDLCDRINLERFIELLRIHKIKFSGMKKIEVFNKIESAINNELPIQTLSVSVLDDFIANEISHGKNRSLYVSAFTDNTARQIKNIEFVKQSLTEKGFPAEPFNNLRTIATPENLELGYFDYIVNSKAEVELISLCFVSTYNLNDEIIDSVSNEVKGIKQTDYVWVNIYPYKNKIITKMWLKQQGNYFLEQSNAKKVYDDISLLTREMFSLAPRNISSIKQTLYIMFKNLTDVAVRPFRDKLIPIRNSIVEFVNGNAKSIGIKETGDPIDIAKRIERLFERVLIQENLDLYQSYFEGKLGYVSRITFSDATGANVNAKAAMDKGIEVADIFFDTRDTLENLKYVDGLWVFWFYRPNENSNIETIEVKLEVFSEHYIIRLLRAYTTKEVEELVLSNIEYFETLQTTTNNNQ